MRHLLLLLAVLLSVAARAVPPDLSNLEFTPHPGAPVPLTGTFLDQNGNPASLRDYVRRRPAILELGYYTCPNLCGVTRDDLAHALASAGLTAGRDVNVVEMSVDPAETTEDAARVQAQLGGAARDWHFLIGPSAPVAQAVGFPSRPDGATGQFLHPAGLVVLTPGGLVSGYLLGVGYDGAALRLAVQRAAASVVSPAPSPVLLLCFHYDPATGRYSLDVLRVMQAAGVVTMLAAGALLASGHMRRR